MFALEEKLPCSDKRMQKTHGVMNDGPLILPHVMRGKKLCNLIIGGTHSALRLINPAWYGKWIHLYQGGDWQLAQVHYGLWQQKNWNNTAGALIKATSYFHHHALQDICIAALPKGTLTQQAELPQPQHNETGYVCMYTTQHTLSFLSQAARVKTLTDSLWWGCR